MNIHPRNFAAESSLKAWTKRMAWGLPLFFLVKGLMWLVVPALFLFFSFD
jgi:hypothetical protein